MLGSAGFQVHIPGASVRAALLGASLGACLTLMAHREVLGQVSVTPVQITTQSCSQCRIERYPLATIQDSIFSGGAIGSIIEEVYAADNGVFLFASSGEVYITDSSGAVIRRIGREGEAPGEFQSPTYIVETDKDYVIVDNRLRRLTRLSKETLDVVHVSRIPGSVRSSPVFFSDGTYVIRADIPGRDGRLHWVSRDGEPLASFGGDYPTSPGSARSSAPTIIAAATDSTFWAAYPDRYRVEKWGVRGNLLAIIERDVDWFEPRRDSNEPGQRYSTVADVSQDDAGRLWIHVAIRTSAGSGRIEPDERSSESIIEVLDIETGSVVASSRFPAWRAFPVGGGIYARDIVDRLAGSGQPLIKVYGFRLIL